MANSFGHIKRIQQLFGKAVRILPRHLFIYKKLNAFCFPKLCLEFLSKKHFLLPNHENISLFTVKCFTDKIYTNIYILYVPRKTKETLEELFNQFLRIFTALLPNGSYKENNNLFTYCII